MNTELHRHVGRELPPAALHDLERRRRDHPLGWVKRLMELKRDAFDEVAEVLVVQSAHVDDPLMRFVARGGVATPTRDAADNDGNDQLRRRSADVEAREGHGAGQRSSLRRHRRRRVDILRGADRELLMGGGSPRTVAHR